MDRRTFLKTGITMGTLLGIPGFLFRKAFAENLRRKAVMIVAHPDDDVIFFLPWLSRVEKVIIAALPGTSAHLNIVSKYASQYRTVWQFAKGITSFQEYKEKWINYAIRKDFITEEDYIRILRDIVVNPKIEEIYTHNPWGEYGHLHHRQISKVVRELAVESGKDVWCPNIVVDLVCSGDDCNYNFTAASFFELSQKRAYFRSDLYERFRQYYLDEPVDPAFPIKYWTGGGPQDFPQGYQEYFLAVSGGMDYTEGHPEIENLKESLPIYGI